MTTGTNPDASAVARRRAAQVLEVREDVSPAEARRAYLGKVRENDFLPPRSLRRALRVLDGTPAPAEPDEEWLFEEECRLRAEVASFAEEFFTLPVAQRRERWNVLHSMCQRVPSLTARLQALKAGLEVEKEGLPLDGSIRGQLAEHLLQSFPLTPLARAASRQAFLHQIEAAPATEFLKLWEKAARYLLAEWPALAALDPALVQHLGILRNRLARRSERSEMHRRIQGNRKAAPAGGSNGNAWWVLWLAVVVVTVLIRTASNSNNSPSSRTPSPSFTSPLNRPENTGLENLRLRLGTDPTTGQSSLRLGHPPIRELLDPSKYDVRVVNPGASGLIFEFKPRPGSAVAGSNGRPLAFGQATLMLMGVTREQINALSSRAAARGPDGTPNPTPPK